MIPGYGRVAQWYAKQLGQSNFRQLEKYLSRLIEKAAIATPTQGLNIVSFSGHKTLVEQLYSMLSFYYNVGLPHSWIVYSDKTHTAKEIELLQRLPHVKVLPWDAQLNIKYDQLLQFGKFNVWGNRLHAYLNHPIAETTIFTDSDILFYKGFKDFIPLINKNNWFIRDTSPHFDQYFFEQVGNPAGPFVNAGFLIFNKLPCWQRAIDFILDRPNEESWEHFTEQAAIHHMMITDTNTKMLDANYFILSASDSFKFSVDYDINTIALRHFVSPVRHKMWQTPWKKVLGV
jgi:hypothetical protein